MKIKLFENYTIEINGNQLIDDNVIINKVYSEINSSLLSNNFKKIKKTISSIDYIQAVQLSPILPNKLRIHIIERNPILILKKEGYTSFLDKFGIILPFDKKLINKFSIPTVTIQGNQIPIDEYQLEISKTFLFILQEYPTLYENLSKIEIKPNIWEFYSNKNTKISTHPDFILTQLNILKNFERTILPKKKLNDYYHIDLRLENKVIVIEKTHIG